MPLFSRSSTLAKETAHSLISGHLGLIAWWALRHAGVLDALKNEPGGKGLNVAGHAARAAMSSEVLLALFTYLTHSNLVTLSDGHASLTAQGRALLDHEDGVLEFVRAYQPALGAMEHLLARLKTYGGSLTRRADSLLDSQVARYGADVFPAVEKAVHHAHASHVLDLNAGGGDLLLRLGKSTKNLAGVGVGPDGPSTRRANEAISKAGLEKRFIAVTGNGVDVCLDTRDAFERLGISTAFWEQVDCVVAVNVFGELAGRDAASTIAALARIPRTFPGATLILAESCADPNREPAYYAAEFDLLLSLSRHALLSNQQWRDMLGTAGMKIVAESPQASDAVTVFTCEPAKRPAKAVAKRSVSPA